MAPFLVDTASGTPTTEWQGDLFHDSPSTAPISKPEISSPSHGPPVPIAICGMALRLPGGLSTPAQFWDFLLSKGDARSPVPKSRYNISAYHSQSGRPGTIKTEYGYFLDESIDISTIDTNFFSMAKVEIERVDPQQRQLLEVVRECFESAGEANYKGKKIGCFVGSFGEDWVEGFSKETQHIGQYRVSGVGDFVQSNRISYEYDLKGPSMTVRTGCSSALIGLHEACNAIQQGQCSSAIVGGTNLITGPSMTIAMTEQGVLSPDGSSRSFSADANGYARGEAINAIFIKPLSDAIRDGNPIRAVIRSTASNCDGKTPGMTMPSSELHEAMIRDAYKAAGISDFSKTAFVECHGTGTQIGDPLEAAAVAAVFGDKGVYIGSVKPNVGHSEGASGITSLIKAVLALENLTIPPNIKFSIPNPKIPFKSKRVTVPVEPTPWPKDRDQRVGVNSFGIGGANAHVIIDSAASFLASSAAKEPTEDTAQLLVFSASTADSLRRQVVNNQTYLEKNPGSQSDLAYTLATRREHLPHRAFSVVGHGISPNTSPFMKTSSSTPDLVMVFTGQGAQWPQMGLELIQSHDIFKRSICSMDKILQGLDDAPKWTIEEELLKGPETSRLQTASYSQPLCTAIQIALVDALAAINIRPYAVIGHSSGEMAAAYAAGRLTKSEAIVAAFYRGIVSGQVTRPGAMAAIGMDWNETSQFLKEGVVIACENSPSSMTISGERAVLEEVLADIHDARPEVLARLLKVDRAYHSHHMRDVGLTYLKLTQKHVLGNSPPNGVIFFSSVTGKKIRESDVLGAQYWQSNLESPVRFRTALANFISLHNDAGTQGGKVSSLAFLEVGPHSALAGPIRQTLAQTSLTYPYIPIMLRSKNCSESFLSAVGQLHLQNVRIDFDALTNVDGSARVLSDLPLYPWQHDNSFWYETRLIKEWRHRKFPAHELLGARISESSDNDPAWRNVLSLEYAPWIRDHNIKGDVIYPCAGYIGMVGEAARQLSSQTEGSFTGFNLRRVVVSTAMVLSEGKNAEIITSLKKHRLTDGLDSVWFEFTISSHNGNAWIKHCSGQVRARTPDDQVEHHAIRTPLPRKFDTTKWYEGIRRCGAMYGPCFQGLCDITTATVGHESVATTICTLSEETRDYPIHPTTIDLFLQMFAIAESQGINRGLKKMCVPTSIEEIEISYGSPALNINVSTSSTPRGVITGHGRGLTSDGKAVLQMKGVKLTPIEDEPSADSDKHAGARLEWQPDIDFLNAAELIKPSREFEQVTPLLSELCSQLCIKSLDRISGIETNIPHLIKFKSWLESQAALASHQGLQTGPTIESLNQQIVALDAGSAAIPMMKVFDNIADIWSGKIDALSVLLPDHTLTNLYNYLDSSDRRAFIQALGHSKPNLHILEIGAGTGGTTNTMLQDLVNTSNGQLMYSNYTFSDISAGFFTAAKERFKQWPNLEFAALDISKNPLEQGFEAGSYDLILATNVLHATPCLQETLANVRQLLHPDGRLLMVELCPESKWTNMIMGVLPGWWLGDQDDRSDEPYVSPKRWDKELRRAGFDGLEATMLDCKEPFQMNACMIARPRGKATSKSAVTLLLAGESGRLAQAFEKELASHGHEVTTCRMTDEVPKNQDVIALVDLQAPFFKDINEEKYKEFQDFISSLGESGMLWLTRPSHIDCEEPDFAQSIGAMRAIRSDTGVHIATCEIDDIDSLPLVAKVFEKFQRRRDDDQLQPDYEYVIADGKVNIGRFYPFSVSEELVGANENRPKAQALDLTIEKYGQLSTLQWTSRPDKVLEGDEVEIEMQAVAMNFKDVLIAMGIVNSTATSLGLEGAGIIRSVGPDVDDLCAGDRVFVLGAGCFSTSVIASSQLCVKIPDSLSFEDASTMPCVFATVIFSLMDIGRLEKGQSVLIHSACGGVGIAAIQICQMMGAEIYATVGNDEKVQYLMSTFGIPRGRIFNSRDKSFLKDILRVTDGRGVDLVLNSLSGELLHASWECVAEFGTLLEIGKRDFIGHGKLAMSIFEANRSYAGIDLGHLIEVKPAAGKRLLEAIIKYYEEGHIQPVRPIKVFAADLVEDCFRYFQKGQHIGKVVISMSLDAGKTLAPAKLPATLALNPDASYLLAGGLGGLGKSISTWMVERGARHLVYLSRSAGTSASDKAFFHELESQGCSVSAVKGSVSKLDDVEKAVNASSRPLKGILQMSMVLRDQAFPRMSHSEWTAAVSPKVEGTWNLHNAALQQPLDFFVCFSSVSGLIGQPGQANYSSGNTFLDAFVQYRQSLNLAATSIDIGMMEDAGYLAQNTAVMSKLRANGGYAIREPELLDALTLAMTGSALALVSNGARGWFVNPSQFAIGLRSTLPLADPANRMSWRRDRRMALYRNVSAMDSGAAKSGAGTNDKLRTFLQTASESPEILSQKASAVFLARQISIKLFDFLLRPVEDGAEDDIDVSHSLQDMGLDSLVAIEMRSWWKVTFGFDISVLEMLGMGSMEALGEHAAKGLSGRWERDEDASDAKQRADPTYLAMKMP